MTGSELLTLALPVTSHVTLSVTSHVTLSVTWLRYLFNVTVSMISVMLVVFSHTVFVDSYLQCTFYVRSVGRCSHCSASVVVV